MMKKLLKISEIATLSNSAEFQNYHRYRPQILITQIEDSNGDCVREIRRLRALLSGHAMSVQAGPGQLIVFKCYQHEYSLSTGSKLLVRFPNSPAKKRYAR